MKKLFFITLILSTVLYNISPLFAQTLNIDPKCAYILIDSKSGQVLAEQNADVKLRPASTTKIMTAIIALEDGKLDSVMNVSAAAVNDIGPGGANIGIMPDESNLTLENLLNVMLIRSANETANIIAENIGESREEFVERMNKKAAELGADNTHFVNPCGKDNLKEEVYHLTTARDLAKISRYAMAIPKFREIVDKLYCNDLPVTNKHNHWDKLQSTNKLLWDVNNYPFTINGVKSSYAVNGIKTGYTDAAGENLVSSAVSKDGTELIAVVMHVKQANDQFKYTKELFKYGFENYSLQKLADSDQVVKSIDVYNGKDTEKIDLVTSSDFSAVLPVDKDSWNVTTKEIINPNIEAPVNKGDDLGYIEYSSNGTVLGRIKLTASRPVEKAPKSFIPDSISKPLMNPVFEKILIGVSIFFGFSILFIITLKADRILKRRSRVQKRLIK